ncbi:MULTISPECIES: BMP family protein [Cyanophyceae]|uniref:BMP family protein n=1 Tax=Cyanophyceae TaxID=3028117 RepID=UPI001F555DA0|nr:BMP family protein [Trichocoleus sp. FACHB-69]
MTKKIICLLLTLLLVACGTTASDITRTAQVKPGAFKVAAIFPGAVDDKAWNQSGYEGLKLIEKELGAEVAYADSVPGADAEKLFRQYAKKGFDFIIGHGGEYIATAKAVSAKFPRNKFAVMSSDAGNNKNFGALAFRAGELGYLTGVVAALKTKTNKVAYIGGQKYASLEEEATLFERGVKQINPSAEVFIDWVGSWTDADKASRISQKLVAAGVDIITVNADTAYKGVIKVVAENKGVYAIRWNHAIPGLPEQQKPPPKIILTNAMQQVPMVMLEGATLVEQGRWEGKQYKFGLQEEIQDLTPFYGSLTPEQEEFINSLKEDIITGKIDATH